MTSSSSTPSVSSTSVPTRSSLPRGHIVQLPPVLLAASVAPYLRVADLLNSQQVSRQWNQAFGTTTLSQLLRAKRTTRTAAAAVKRQRNTAANSRVPSASEPTLIDERDVLPADEAILGVRAWQQSCWKARNTHLQRTFESVDWQSLKALACLDLSDGCYDMDSLQFEQLMHQLIPAHCVQLRSLKVTYRALQSYDMSDDEDTDDVEHDLDAVAGLNRLTTLDLDMLADEDALPAEYVTALVRNNTQLTDVRLQGCTLQRIEDLPTTLTTLHLSSVLTLANIQAMTGRFPALEDLVLQAAVSSADIDDDRDQWISATSELIEASTRLRELQLVIFPTPGSVLEQICRLSSLRALHLIACRFDDDCDAGLRSLLQLTTLVIQTPDVEVADDDIETAHEWVPSYETLRHTLRDTKLTSLTIPLNYDHTDLNWMAGLPVRSDLLSLTFAEAEDTCLPLEFEMVTELCRIAPCLTQLTVPSQSSLDDSGLAAIATELPALQKLVIGESERLTGVGLNGLKALQQLSHLEVTIQDVALGLADVLIHAKQIPSLTSLHVSCSHAHDETSGMDLPQLISRLKTLTVESYDSLLDDNLAFVASVAQAPNLQSFTYHCNLSEDEETGYLLERFIDASYAARSSPAAQCQIEGLS